MRNSHSTIVELVQRVYQRVLRKLDPVPQFEAIAELGEFLNQSPTWVFAAARFIPSAFRALPFRDNAHS